MRNPTKREQAEAIVAMVRAEYPEPQRASDNRPGGYCVGLAYNLHFRNKHRDLSLPRVRIGTTRDGLNVGLNAGAPSIAGLNNTGDFEGAWALLTDQIEAAL